MPSPIRPSVSESKHTDWVVSTTATHHLTHQRHAFTDYKYIEFGSYIVSNSRHIPIVGIGTVDLEVYATSPCNWSIDRKTKVKRPDTIFLSLKNVLHIPSGTANVFSPHAINESGYDVILNSREGGGYLQEYHDFVLEHKAYACITMNRRHYVLKVITKDQVVRAQHGLSESPTRTMPIPSDALLSFDWPDTEEQKWTHHLKDKGEFDGEYIDRIQEESEKFPHGRKQDEERKAKRKYGGSFESQFEGLFQELEEDEIVDDW